MERALPAVTTPVQEMASLDVDSLSPLEALTKLYQLKERAAQEQ